MKKWTSPSVGMTVILAVMIGLSWLAAVSPAAAAVGKDDGQRITGRVVSAYGPVADARVRVAGDEKYALTDRQGRFELATGHLLARRLRVTAGKDGWFNNALVSAHQGRAGDISLNPIPRGDRSDYRFISPVTCARCHSTLAKYWDRSKMAHTTSNPKVLDMYYGTDANGRQGIGPGYKRFNPDGAGNCAVCHAPSSSVTDGGSRDLQSALWSPRTEWDGISCDYCHKVRKVIRKTDRPGHMAPILSRHTPVRGNTILVFGPYDDVVNGAMAASYSPLYDKGQFCATCHTHFKKLPPGTTWDRKKIYSDAEWTGFGLEDDTQLPIQTTYREWKQWQDGLDAKDSNKGKRCQDCHMSWRKEMLPYDNYVVDGQARNMWGTWREPRNIRPHHFDGGTETQLKTALSMEIEGQVADGKLTVTTFITNTNGGHWVPTGETMRSVMLHVKAFNSAGKPLKLIKGPRLPDWTGKGDPAAGNYAGQPGRVFARVLKDRTGRLHVPFWQASGIAFDSRIRPKTTVAVRFEFAVTDPDDEPSAEARLIYRPVVKPLAQVKGWQVKDIPITSSVW